VLQAGGGLWHCLAPDVTATSGHEAVPDVSHCLPSMARSGHTLLGCCRDATAAVTFNCGWMDREHSTHTNYACLCCSYDIARVKVINRQDSDCLNRIQNHEMVLIKDGIVVTPVPYRFVGLYKEFEWSLTGPFGCQAHA
jgi:hypothetical protein